MTTETPQNSAELNIIGVAIVGYVLVIIVGALGQVGVCEHRARDPLECQPAWNDYYQSLDQAGALFLALMAKFPGKALMDAIKKPRKRRTPTTEPEVIPPPSAVELPPRRTRRTTTTTRP